MKVSELLALLSGTNVNNRHHDDEIVIKITKPSVGPSACEPIVSAHFGIDWDARKVILRTDRPLVVKSENEEIYDMSRDLMLYLATKPMKRKSYEVEKAQSILKRTGMTEKDFIKYRRLFHPLKIDLKGVFTDTEESC